MKEIILIKTDNPQGIKHYSSINLTVYGKLIKLTAGGSGKGSENKAKDPNNPKP